jgi:hypothetical protein
MENEGRDTKAIDELLKELSELRELDRRRQAHAPGSVAHDAASLEVDLRSRRLMDRFRDLKQQRAQAAERRELASTEPVQAEWFHGNPGGSRLN